MLAWSTALITVLLLTAYRTVCRPTASNDVPLWLFALLVSNLPINSFITNYEYLVKPKKPDPYVASLLLQYVAIPLIVLFAIRGYRALRGVSQGGPIVLGSAALLLGSWLARKAGIVGFRHWQAGWVFLFWCAVVALTAAISTLLQSDLMKRGKRLV